MATDRKEYMRQRYLVRRAEDPEKYRRETRERNRRWRASKRTSGYLIAQKGEPLEFLRSHIDYSGDDCLEWPFGKGGGGYGALNIKGVVRAASRWMCIFAHGEAPSPDHESAHSCGNRPCVNPNHLRWATVRENHADCKIHGTENWGENNGKTRLTNDDVRAIRADTRPQKIIAAEYNVDRSTIAKIRSGDRWGHIS